MKIGVVLGTNEPETAWNAFRFAVKALDSGHTVRVFLLGPGVESEGIRQGAYDVPEQMQAFADRGGECSPAVPAYAHVKWRVRTSARSRRCRISSI